MRNDSDNKSNRLKNSTLNLENKKQANWKDKPSDQSKFQNNKIKALENEINKQASILLLNLIKINLEFKANKFSNTDFIYTKRNNY